MPLQLFLIGFLVLFLELASIRWFAAYVVFLQFFTNVVLLAAFLGMSCGCLAARRRTDWLGRFPALALTAAFTALAAWAVFVRWARLNVDVGNQAAPQEVFFGTELKAPDMARFVVPIEWVAALFFVLVAFMFVGLGQALGRAFAAETRRVRGYAWNIAGSLCGIVAFSAVSFAEAPPLVWFLIVAVGVAFLLQREGRLDGSRGLLLIAFVSAMGLPLARLARGSAITTRWSPYYAIEHDRDSGSIGADNITHQTMRPFETRGAEYSLVHLLQKSSGGRPFADVLVIGAGSGNDMAHALRFGARHVDAVEIDPVIQDLGARFHPNRPYQDPRVSVHLDDGRHFLRTTDRRYDLVIYAVVDSLILHSGFANIRLESFLFTAEAFRDIRRVLREDGVFVAYNDYRQGWILERVNAMAEAAFGTPTLVLTIPHRETLTGSAPVGPALVIAGANRRIADAFERHGGFWLNGLPPRNLYTNGFSTAGEARDGWQRLAPSTLAHGEERPLRTTDDWPFLYMRDRRVPDLTVRSTLILVILGLGLVYAFLGDRRAPFDRRMFFLGAAFMLLEARAVVQMALLFGSTWVVNAFVVGAVLVLVLLANVHVLRAGRVGVAPHYAAMLALLAIGAAVPLNAFLAGSALWRIGIPMALALGPIFFSAVVFAQSFQDAERPDHALGMNIAGAVVGGLSESLSTLLGFRALLLVVGLFVVLSIGRRARGSA